MRCRVNGDFEVKKAVDKFPRTNGAIRRIFDINIEQSSHVETVCSLVLRKPVTHINIDVDVEELVQEKRGQATYPQIKEYVLEHSWLPATCR